MQGLSEATNLSNWTLALILGSAAALKSGAQQGMQGELPFCDALLVLTSFNSRWRNRYPSGDNVFIGFDSLWARMMLKTFQARRLKFVTLLLKENGLFHPDCGCHMVRDPSEVEWGSDVNFFWRSIQHARQTLPTKDASAVHYGNNTAQVRPNMFYGLVDTCTKDVKDQTDNPSRHTKTHLAVHRPSCILQQEVDKRAIEFQPDALTKMLEDSDNNQDAKNKCERLIRVMGNTVETCDKANDWDKGIINRIYDLMDFPNSAQVSVSLNETMDRIHSRIPGMLQRLRLETFIMDGSTYTIEDVSRASVVYFGLLRALYMSRLIYGDQSCTENPVSAAEGNITRLRSNVQETTGILETIETQEPIALDKFVAVNMDEDGSLKRTKAEDPGTRGLVFMGYNIKVGHELIRDIVEIPTLNGLGYSSAQVIEDTQKERIIVNTVDFSSIFTTSIFLDLALAVAIMLLSGIGPILSMYTARLATAPYRESYLKMGTSMRWAVGEALMFHSGTARDDWMVGIRPVQHPRKAITRFLGMAGLSCIVPIVLWASPLPLWNQFRTANDGENPPIPSATLAQLICILGLIVGFAWVLVSFLNHTPNPASAKGEESVSWRPAPGLVAHIIINVCLTALPVAVVYGGVEANWVYLYLLEGVYFCHWLVGELFGLWVYESTALFMAGVVGAIRLSALSSP